MLGRKNYYARERKESRKEALLRMLRHYALLFLSGGTKRRNPGRCSKATLTPQLLGGII